MSQRYFNYFPRIQYSLSDNKFDSKIVANILAKSAFLDEISKISGVYYEYQMKDSDTPEIIADKFYGSVQKHWIVLLFNKIINPYYEIPRNREELEDYIVKKYGYASINTAYSQIHHYEQITTASIYYNNVLESSSVSSVIINENNVDYDTGALSDRNYLPGPDQTTDQGSDTISYSSSTYVVYSYKTKAVSVYTYEDQENEKKRSIKLLKNEYVSRVEAEMERLMRG